ncbi:MAG: hypothetical protein NT069_18240, partial [Planctomycetota bacterium]|nr:hypothetical protein [Planctomycetota bacterium]
MDTQSTSGFEMNHTDTALHFFYRPHFNLPNPLLAHLKHVGDNLQCSRFGSGLQSKSQRDNHLFPVVEFIFHQLLDGGSLSGFLGFDDYRIGIIWRIRQHFRNPQRAARLLRPSFADDAKEIPLDGVRGISTEPESPGEVEFLDRVEQRHIAIADQIVKRTNLVRESAGYGNHQPQIRTNDPFSHLTRQLNQLLDLPCQFSIWTRRIQSSPQGIGSILEQIHQPEQFLFFIGREQGGVVKFCEICRNIRRRHSRATGTRR